MKAGALVRTGLLAGMSLQETPDSVSMFPSYGQQIKLTGCVATSRRFLGNVQEALNVRSAGNYNDDEGDQVTVANPN